MNFNISNSYLILHYFINPHKKRKESYNGIRKLDLILFWSDPIDLCIL